MIQVGNSTDLQNIRQNHESIPICSMYGIFTYIWAIFGVNVGKYSIHGAYGISFYIYIYISLYLFLCIFIYLNISKKMVTSPNCFFFWNRHSFSNTFPMSHGKKNVKPGFFTAKNQWNRHPLGIEG